MPEIGIVEKRWTDRVAQHVVSWNIPVLFLDTCVILDILRDPQRPKITPSCVAASLYLLQRLREETLVSVISDVVLDEFHGNAEKVSQETCSSVVNILESTNREWKVKLDRLASLFGLELNNHESFAKEYIENARRCADEWLCENYVIGRTSDIKQAAQSRINSNLRPASRGRESRSDCEILESLLAMTKDCRKRGLEDHVPILFISSNTRDFAQTGMIHPDIAPEFQLLNIRYFTNLGDVRMFLSRMR